MSLRAKMSNLSDKCMLMVASLMKKAITKTCQSSERGGEREF